MIPVIYQCCDESTVDISVEDSLLTTWSDHPPLVDDLVSMGGDRKWRVVEVSEFKPVALAEDIAAVYLVEVHVDGLPVPSKDKWVSNTFKDDHPDESIDLKLVDNAIEIGFDMRGFAPEIGSHLLDYEQICNTTAMRSIERPWVVDRVALYLPSGTAPYSKVHLCHCKKLSLVAA